MASPPSNSPVMPNLNIARKRPSLGTPTNIGSKRRKISTIAGPSHLRQTSFPPEGVPNGSRSPSVDSSVAAATPSDLSGGPRKRKGKAGKDDASAVGSQISKAKSGVNGGGSTVNGVGGEEDGDGDDEDDGGDVAAVVEGGKMSEAARKQEEGYKNMLVSAFTSEQDNRYNTYRRVKLRKESVRKLTNHTLSQSVPASIITTINGYTKVLIAELVERARDVQLEWQVSSTTLPTGTKLPDDAPLEERLRQEDRGPLLPDHLREAYRRYRKDREGGCAGLLGLSLNGREGAAARMGGKKLFR
ncbi:histone-fold-containing protein [Tothia fuscella]|uniref:Histone-fold-containing protein n=1 Tax=Tothia fuscella TaxID=1048955 RepID=A0A9P4U1M5_9PEZI|nr:histone-fold-containing protein [Tothia fuscella]